MNELSPGETLSGTDRHSREGGNRKRIPADAGTKTAAAFRDLLENNLYYTLGSTVQSASVHDTYLALAYTVRDHLIDRWRHTSDAQYEANPKFVYYLSAEYLLGQQLTQNMLYTGHLGAGATGNRRTRS